MNSNYCLVSDGIDQKRKIVIIFSYSGHNEQFADKTDLPHGLLHVNNRLYCMYTDQVGSIPTEKKT